MVEVWQKYECKHSEMGFISAIYCSNTSSVAVNRATFSRWRRLIKSISADCIDKISPSVLIRLFIFRKRGHLASLLQRGIDRFAQANAVGVAETGAEGGSRRLTDEASIMLIALFRQRRYYTHARQPFYAGVRTMRARICSAISCAMFARVVV